MDKYEFSNWQKIKEALEKSGKTDSFYYKRAVAIVDGAKDPLDIPVIKADDES